MIATFIVWLFACTATGDSAADSAAPVPPTITFLSPADGESVSAGAVTFSVIVDDFTLVDLAKDAGGVPEGYIGVRVDGEEVLQTGETNFSLQLDTGGQTVVEAELFFSDGDGMDEAFGAAVSASVGLTVTTP